MLLLSRYALQHAVFMISSAARPCRDAEKPTRGRVSADSLQQRFTPAGLTCGGLILVQVSSASGCSSSASWGDVSSASPSGVSVTDSVGSTVSTASAASSARAIHYVRLLCCKAFGVTLLQAAIKSKNEGVSGMLRGRYSQSQNHFLRLSRGIMDSDKNRHRNFLCRFRHL